MELLGEAHDDHEEQQDYQSWGAHGQTHHLELSNHRLATGTLVPDVVLDVASEADKEVSEDRLREKLSQVELHIESKIGDKGRKQSRTKRYDRDDEQWRMWNEISCEQKGKEKRDQWVKIMSYQFLRVLCACQFHVLASYKLYIWLLRII